MILFAAILIMYLSIRPPSPSPTGPNSYDTWDDLDDPDDPNFLAG